MDRKKISLTLIIFMLLASFSSPLWGLDNKPKAKVSHDRKSDRLTVEAVSAPLKEVLSKAGLLTGIEILIDKGVTKTVSVKFHGEPVEKGLKKIIKAAGGLSHAMVYSRGKKKDDKPVLTSMTVLPAGKADKKEVVPATELEKEVAIRDNMHSPSKEKTDSGRSTDSRRWKTRLDNLPPETREKLLKQQQRRRALWRANKERREKRREEINKLRMKRWEHLKETDPEEYERRMKRLEERENRKEPQAAQ